MFRQIAQYPIKRPLLLGMIWILLISSVGFVDTSTAQQDNTPEQQALALFDILSSEERIGQLFLVTFSGTDVGPESQIYDLITNYHIGGVIMQVKNDNFSYVDDPIYAIINLTRNLQDDEWRGTIQSRVDPGTGLSSRPKYIPLFIGVSQDGDGFLYDQFIKGLTSYPSQMAIGATWNTKFAYEVAFTLGKELKALGINMLFGPSLNILENPTTFGPGDLGTSTFGGDPFWVGEMGRAFISGVHHGSGDQMTLVGTNFPGQGSSDRFPKEEVATVRKSLEQLKQMELAPFFTTTGLAKAPDERLNGLLTSTIRYQGFQGNIRASTSPISFDRQAIDLLMKLPSLETWRNSGGFLVTDDLGGRPVRKFYDPKGTSFNARYVARDAFLAGNDLLFLGDVKDTQNPDTYTTVLNTITFFNQKYRDDAAFRERVDESVLKILTEKFRLYRTFTLTNVLASFSDLDLIGKSGDVAFSVAQKAATLIHPARSELANNLPNPPQAGDHLVIMTDSRVVKQCTDCPEETVIPKEAFKDAIIRLYGPFAGGQIQAQDIRSFSYSDLMVMLDNQGNNHLLEDLLKLSDWIIFVMQDINKNLPDTLAMQRLLDERPDLLLNKKVVAFGFAPPYYFDATNISKLTAYYGLYSNAPAFIDVAVRLLFQEISAPGASPVSIPGIGYDLIKITSPLADQVIPLVFDLVQPTETPVTVTPESIPVPDFKLGDLIPVKTGVIIDHNRNPVPDGTVVRFIMDARFEGGAEQETLDTTTTQGKAYGSFRVNRAGTLEIRVESEPAQVSEILHVEILPEEVTHLPETATVTPTETKLPATVQIELTAEDMTTISQGETKIDQDLFRHPGIQDWIQAVFTSLLIGWIAYTIGNRTGHIRRGTRSGLASIVGGLVCYTYFALDFPGSEKLLGSLGSLGLILGVILGSITGWIIVWFLHMTLIARERGS